MTGSRSARSAAMSRPSISDVAEVDPHELAEVVDELDDQRAGSSPAPRSPRRSPPAVAPGPSHDGARAAVAGVHQQEA